MQDRRIVFWALGNLRVGPKNATHNLVAISLTGGVPFTETGIPKKN